MLGPLGLVVIALAGALYPPQPGITEVPAKGVSTMDVIANAHWRFGGELGARIERNVTQWLLRAPDANPGLIEMFRRRDRRLPYDTPVPWAGEFAGKYLISGVQALRMTDDPKLETHLAAFVADLVSCQADDGYLGPWPKDERLLGHWDLWGHYHCMLGLVMWHDHTGDAAAWKCVLRAADCICDIYADGERRPIDAGAPQINLSVLHVFGQIYCRTGNPRYLRLIERIEEDIAKDGDWLRLGEAGVPYYQLPGGGTRWESLHIVQGIIECYLITGEERYKKAAVSLWESLRRFDRHPSGAFSTNECAYGSPYALGAIETCCSVAWEALTIDVLRLTGDARVADELELTTWNQVLAAQHPSGSWWTYDTPMDGVRVPSFQHISFQYRPGTPELNCCSVNAPRGLGMLSEWAVLEDDEGLVVNFYGPGRFDIERKSGERVVLTQETAYPLSGAISITVQPTQAAAFTLRLRVPEWSRHTTVAVNGRPLEAVPVPGTYLAVKRTWTPGDRVELGLDMAPRYWAGEEERYGRAAVYTGPLLLAFDAFFNEAETADMPAIEVDKLGLKLLPIDVERRPGKFPPMGLWEVTTEGGGITLCDFASAGAHGTDYVAWLPVAHVPAPPVSLSIPEHGTVGTPGPILFRWRDGGPYEGTYTLLVARDAAFKEVVLKRESLSTSSPTVGEGLNEEGDYFWKVLTGNENGISENRDGPRRFRVSGSADRPFFALGEHSLLLDAPLDGDGTPALGLCSHQRGLEPAPDRNGQSGRAVAFDGATSELRYELPFFPNTDYTFCAWACPEVSPSGLQQIGSAWHTGMDDPLRVCVEDSQLTARIEAGSFYGTEGVHLENGVWAHIAAVKQGETLTLFVDGKPAKKVRVPGRLNTKSTQLGIGFNPLFDGGERFKGRLDDVVFYAEALSPAQIASIYTSGKP